MPVPKMVLMPHGTRPGWLLAVLTTLLTPKIGPGRREVRVKVCERLASEARMEMGPACEPALTFTDAWPAAFVVTVAALRVAEPLATEKVTA